MRQMLGVLPGTNRRTAPPLPQRRGRELQWVRSAHRRHPRRRRDGGTAGRASVAERNRAIAIDSLVRDGDRATALLDAVKSGKVPATTINDAQRKRLLEHGDDAVRKHAAEVFSNR
jgi:hypothetical protein